MFSKRTLSLLTVGLILAIIGAGIWWRLRPEPEGEEQSENIAIADSLGIDVESATQQFSTDAPNPVSGAEVVQDTLWIQVTASGQAEAIRRTTVNSRVEGLLLSLPVQENDRVVMDNPVAFIDTLDYVMALAVARSNQEQALENFRRATLFDEELDPEVRASREQALRIQHGLEAAEIEVTRAEMDLDRTTVRAPFQGRIADMLVVEGQYITAGTELMTIVDLDPIKVEVRVLEGELQHLAEGRRASVRFTAFPGDVFEGRVETINPVVGEDRAARVTVILSNPQGRIKPGMYAEVTLEAQSLPDRILVPKSAILETTDGTRRQRVFAFDGEGNTGVASWIYVQTGAFNNELIEIVPSDEGMVEPGQIVLISGHQYLAHGVPVQLVENPRLVGGRPGV